MANFNVNGSGVLDLRNTDLSAFDGLTFATSGAMIVTVNSTQVDEGNPVLAYNLTGSGFQDTYEIYVGAGLSFSADLFTFNTWTNGLDQILIVDSGGSSENITGSSQSDIIQLFGGPGVDTVNGGGGTDLLRFDFSADAGAFTMNGASQFTDFTDTTVVFSNIERFNLTFGNGGDNITTLGGDDTLNGGGGNDTLNSAAGAVIIDGGSGNDLWIADFSTDPTVKTINLNLAGSQAAGNGTTYTSIERLNISGGAGADVLITRTSDANDSLDDTLNGGGGDDTITVGGGLDVVNGGAENDLLIVDYTTDSGAQQMNGAAMFTDFSNTQVSFTNIERFDLRLGTGSDNIVTLGGADTINGGNGNDSLNSAAGEADIDGGTGNDLWVADFTGDASIKTINLNLAGLQNAGNGSSYISVERLNISGGAGADVLTTRTSNANDGLDDTLNGGGGNDILTVGGGHDVVDGGSGDNDLLIVDYTTDNGALQMNGAAIFTDFSNTQVSFSNIERFDVRLGSGNDSIVTLGGSDTLNGGGGNDRLDSAAGSAVINGGAGVDTWAANLSSSSIGLTVNLNTALLQNIGNASSLTSIEALVITGGSGNDSFLTRTINADENISDIVNGGGGDDSIRVGGGLDTVDGGVGGDDLLIVGYATETSALIMNGAAIITDLSNTGVTFSNVERFDVTVGSGNDSVVTLGGSDTLNGGAGNDTLNSAAGAAVVNGGSGNDVWAADFSGDATAKVINLNLAGVQSAGNGSTYTGIERLSITGGNGADIFTTRIGNANDGFNDTVNAGGSNDRITVGGGIDVVDGGSGNDLLVIDYSTEDLALQNNGASSITDFSNTSISFSNVERFNVLLGAGNDSVTLLGNADTIGGGGGNDTLNTAAGSAVVDGGAGNDLWVADFTTDPSVKVIDLNLTGVQSAGNGTTYVNVERMNMTGGAGNDVLTSRTGNTNDGFSDTLNGGGGNDIITVGGGLDVANGGDGADDLLVIDYATETLNLSNNGAAIVTDFSNTSITFSNFERFDMTLGLGNDNVLSGAGDDTLNGGGGSDTLAGGLGNDTYVFGAGDVFMESPGGGFDTILFAANGSLAGFSNIEAIALTGSANANLSGDTLANALTGNSGDNILNGNAGADTMTGGAGNDTYYVDHAGDVTDENFNEGTDLVSASISRTLSVNIENLNLSGTASISGNGNTTANIINGNSGDNILRGYEGGDTLNGNAGGDILLGGTSTDFLNPGSDAVRDIIRFGAVSDSTGSQRDIVAGMDLNGEDVFDFTVTLGVLAAVSTGSLSLASINADIAAAVNGALAAGGAVLFDPTAGDLNIAGHSFLVVDANGDGAYTANQDYVVQLINPTGTLTLDDFI